MSDDPWEMGDETEMYYKVETADDKGGKAAFKRKLVAELIAERFNERYETDYEVVEADEASTAELMRGKIVTAGEGI